MEYFLIESIIVCSLSFIVVIVSSNKESNLVSLIWKDIDFEVVNSYTTYLLGIYNIITVGDKSTWVTDYTKQVVRQINIDNDNITTTKRISCNIYKDK
jgi:hypothetical protein